MNREKAIEEIGWYHSLVERKIAVWGRKLSQSHRERLTGNITDVAEVGASLNFVQYDDGYYIGQTDEEQVRQGYGIYTRTTARRDRWVMQAGFWQQGRPMGSHTVYDADAPSDKRCLASVYYSGERRNERGTVEFSLSPEGVNASRRKFRRYEGFSFSTMFVGMSMIYIIGMVITHNARVSLMAVIIVGLLYVAGITRARE